MAMRTLIIAGLVVLSCGVSGCVSRELYITSEPEGAAVLINDTYRGTTPMTHKFVHYQTFGMRLEKEGYNPFYVEEKVAPPLYERPGLDFVSEALVPKKINDRREFHYTLEKVVEVDDIDAVLARAAAKREAVAEAARLRAERDVERTHITLPLPLKYKEDEEEIAQPKTVQVIGEELTPEQAGQTTAAEADAEVIIEE